MFNSPRKAMLLAAAMGLSSSSLGMAFPAPIVKEPSECPKTFGVALESGAWIRNGDAVDVFLLKNANDASVEFEMIASRAQVVLVETDVDGETKKRRYFVLLAVEREKMKDLCSAAKRGELNLTPHSPISSDEFGIPHAAGIVWAPVLIGD